MQPSSTGRLTRHSSASLSSLGSADSGKSSPTSSRHGSSVLPLVALSAPPASQSSSLYQPIPNVQPAVAAPSPSSSFLATTRPLAANCESPRDRHPPICKPLFRPTFRMNWPCSVSRWSCVASFFAVDSRFDLAQCHG